MLFRSNGALESEKTIRDMGLNFYNPMISRTSLNVFTDFKSIFLIANYLRKNNIDIVLSYTIKPVLYNLFLTIFFPRVRFYSLISGLGYAFGNLSFKQRMIGKILEKVYRLSTRNLSGVIFQNNDDRDLLISKKILSSDINSIVVNGSGVPLEKFYFQAPLKKQIIFMMVARILYDKGVIEFFKAAKIIKQKYPNIKFKYYGDFDSNPAHISKKVFFEYVNEGNVEYCGYKKNLTKFYIESSVFVLPSYREGRPRSVIEAMSCGRAIITTNAPGCREAIRDKVNGFIINPKDHIALAKAMEVFILNQDLIVEMGYQSRRIAEEIYDEKIVAEDIAKFMEII